MRTFLAIVLFCLAAIPGCAPAWPRGDVSGWITHTAVPIRELESGGDLEIGNRFAHARVVGLGEATHGQHESFKTKRAVTMHLIRNHAYRIVAYEASATKAAACDAYVSGTSDDLDAAMRGFGMLIWTIEENAALLRDLRAWNSQASPSQRVRFVGIDVQDTASAERFASALEKRWPSDATLVRSIGSRLEAATQKMFGGDRADYDNLVRETIELIDRVRPAIDHTLDPAHGLDLRSALREFEGTVHMYLTPGRRDRAMADLTLGVLEDSGPDARIVLWAHNGHITRSPLRYLGSDELAAGGHLAKALGDRYYGIGFAFGSGDFIANDQDSGKWIFRTYRIDAPPVGSLEHSFANLREPSLLDLRRDSGDPAIEAWKRAGHGQRWFGGYRVPADVTEISRDASKLMPTYPGEAFDALLYLPRTTASTPRK